MHQPDMPECVLIYIGVRGFHSRVIFSWVRWSTGLGLFEIFVVVVVVFHPEITRFDANNPYKGFIFGEYENPERTPQGRPLLVSTDMPECINRYARMYQQIWQNANVLLNVQTNHTKCNFLKMRSNFRHK